jgi:hypothetical protein
MSIVDDKPIDTDAATDIQLPPKPDTDQSTDGKEKST